MTNKSFIVYNNKIIMPVSLLLKYIYKKSILIMNVM